MVATPAKSICQIGAVPTDAQEDLISICSTASTFDRASELAVRQEVCDSDDGISGEPEVEAGHVSETPINAQSWEDFNLHGKLAIRRALVAAAAFGALHAASARVLPALVGPKLMNNVLRSKDPQHRRYFAEMVGSTVHAGFAGISALVVVVAHRRRHGFDTDIFKPYPAWFDVYFSASCGWSLWDMGAMLGSGEPLSMWLHHLIVLSGSLLIQCYRRAAFFPAAFGLTELTVLPHNAIWYLSALGLRASHPRLEAKLALIRAAFFLLFRFPTGPATIAYAMGVHGGSDFWQKYRGLSPVIQGATAFNVLVLSVLNCVWTWGAVRSAWRLAPRVLA